MTLGLWSFIIAFIALTISIWSRIETYLINTRLHKTELAKRVGEALVSSQLLKNALAENIEVAKNYVKNPDDQMLNIMLQDTLSNLEKEYKEIWGFVKAFEFIIGKFEINENQLIEPAAIEAKIAHFNQRRALVEFDIASINKKVK